MPLISVVIPCYNSEKYIEKCLESFECQIFKDFEVILVDDCSTDNTVEVIEKFRLSHTLNLIFAKNEVNFGPAKSRNKGIAISNAEYIAFCDSDDWYDARYLQLMAKEAENAADMIFCNSNKILVNGRVVKIYNIGEIADKNTIEDVLVKGIDSLCCLMVKRSIIIDIPQPDIRNGEDMAIIPLLIMRSEKIGYVKENIYNYLCRPGSLSLNANASVVRSLETSFDYIVENKVKGYESEIEFIGVKNVVYGALLNYYKYSSKRSGAYEILCRFEKKYPEWYKNKYINSLNIYKRVFVLCAKYRLFAGLKLLSCVHKLITGKGA